MNILIILMFLTNTFITSIICAENAQDFIEKNKSLKAEIRLTSSILNLVDGKTGLMDAEKIRGINYMIQEIGKIQHGTVDKATGLRIGKYLYHGHLYTLKGMAKLENELPKLSEESKDLLKKLKSDLAKITDPNLEESKGSKHFMKILIHEWAGKANKLNSLVVQWSNLGENTDQEEFRKTLTNFRMVDSYCSDLLQFLSTLKRSCPKALKLYENKYHRPA